MPKFAYADQIGEPAYDSDKSEDQKIASGLRWSFGLHLLIAGLILFKSLVFPGAPIMIPPTLRVDIVGLPDLLKNEKQMLPSSTKDISETLKRAEKEAKDIKPIKPPPPAPKVEVEKALPNEMVLKPKPAPAAPNREKNLKAALNRIKALEKISADDAPAKKSSAPLIKGNMISKGSSLSGEAREAAQTSYYDLIREKVHENFGLPVWLSRQNLAADVQLYIDAYGRLKGMRFNRSSGNSQFDSAVKKAISDSQPFPAPPEGISSSLLANGISLGFPL